MPLTRADRVFFLPSLDPFDAASVGPFRRALIWEGVVDSGSSGFIAM